MPNNNILDKSNLFKSKKSILNSMRARDKFKNLLNSPTSLNTLPQCPKTCEFLQDELYRFTLKDAPTIDRLGVFNSHVENRGVESIILVDLQFNNQGSTNNEELFIVPVKEIETFELLVESKRLDSLLCEK